MKLGFWRRGKCGGSERPAAAPKLPETDGGPVLGSEGTGKLVPEGHMIAGVAKATCAEMRVERRRRIDAMARRRLALQAGLNVQYGKQASTYLNGGYERDVAGLAEENASVIRLAVATHICRGLEAAERRARKSGRSLDAGLYDMGLSAAEAVMGEGYYGRGIGEIKGAYMAARDELAASMENAGMNVPADFGAVVAEFKHAASEEVERAIKAQCEARAVEGGLRTPEELRRESLGTIGRIVEFVEGLFWKHDHK